MKTRSHWSYYPVFLSLTVPWFGACDRGTTEPAPSINQRPIAEGALPWEALTPGDIFFTSAGRYFRDPDDDLLDHTARSRNPGVVAARMQGETLILSAVTPGVAEITVSARDPEGLSASHRLIVTVAPTAEASGAAPTADPAAERPR